MLECTKEAEEGQQLPRLHLCFLDLCILGGFCVNQPFSRVDAGVDNVCNLSTGIWGFINESQSGAPYESDCFQPCGLIYKSLWLFITLITCAISAVLSPEFPRNALKKLQPLSLRGYCRTLRSGMPSMSRSLATYSSSAPLAKVRRQCYRQ